MKSEEQPQRSESTANTTMETPAKGTPQKGPDSSPKEEGSSVRLRKELGLLEGITMILGIIIGSGIFVAPKGVITYVGSVGMSLIVWAASGLLTMLGALCYAELGFLSWVNCVNVKWATKVQNVFTVSKVVALTVVIVTGAVYLGTGHLDNYQDPMYGTDWRAGVIATAFYQSLFSYSGWENLYYVAEELKNPNRNLPLAIIVSTSLVTFIYTFTNAAYLAVLTPTEMISSSAVAVTFANRTLGVMAWIMPVFVICSTFGSTNGVIFTQSRLIFAAARKGHFPEALSLVNIDHVTPMPAIVIHGVGLLLMLVTSDVVMLINYTSCVMTLTNLGCMGALFWFRYREPDRERPFKVWLVLPVVFTVTQVFLLVLPIIQNPLEVGVAVVFIVSGLPIYYITIYCEPITKKLSRPMRRLTIWCQLLFRSLPEKEA